MIPETEFKVLCFIGDQHSSLHHRHHLCKLLATGFVFIEIKVKHKKEVILRWEMTEEVVDLICLLV